MVETFEDVSVLETGSAEFLCKVDQSGYINGKWFHDGDEISGHDSKYGIKTIEMTQQLVINNVTASDSGNYAYVGGSDSVAQADLHVTSVSIAEEPRDSNVYETASAKFDVNLSHADAKGQWYKDGLPIKVRCTTNFLAKFSKQKL